MSKVGLEGCEDCEDLDWGCAGCGCADRVGEAGRAVLLASAFVDAALCRVVGVEKGFGAAYLERSLETFV
ncbi:hypothetical protein L227DRAFT_287474 [Lentinus tigrinus ALCF2SS1-6]|uniref:Uncharacterized protein n=1 Tax=Lentinus tigrinus ALCF2SS1-6 TaxID=1328759 RepID=A0A5C2RYI3_9APHY|nr:hypothetical protein L227DRAFT_287474 [Lentinus tigrinus ALCF2SS1-6]